MLSLAVEVSGKSDPGELVIVPECLVSEEVDRFVAEQPYTRSNCSDVRWWRLVW